METEGCIEEYKGRTNSNNPTEPTVHVATLYYYSIYMIDKKGQQRGRLLPTQPSLQPKLAGRGSDTI